MLRCKLSFLILLFVLLSSITFAQKRVRPKPNHDDRPRRAKTIRQHDETPRNNNHTDHPIRGENKYSKKNKRKITKPARSKYLSTGEKVPLNNEHNRTPSKQIKKVKKLTLNKKRILRCGQSIIKSNDKSLQISSHPYNNFPLRLIDVKIEYNYSIDSFKYYTLSLFINATHDNYSSPFGMLINFDQGKKILIKFNEDEHLLYYGEKYFFKKDIRLTKTGYINLKIGYYDEVSNTFYPENFINSKTDKLIYIENVTEIFPYEAFSEIM